jgi:hypothetical protein
VEEIHQTFLSQKCAKYLKEKISRALTAYVFRSFHIFTVLFNVTELFLLQREYDTNYLESLESFFEFRKYVHSALGSKLIKQFPKASFSDRYTMRRPRF